MIKQNPLVDVKLLRRTIAVLGMSLPILVYLNSTLSDNCPEILSSISTYYHTSSQNIFVGVLCMISISMFVYKGPEKDNKKDRIASFIAAICALGVAFFPTDCDALSDCLDFRRSWTGWVHNISAITLFSTFGYMAYTLFTLSDGEVKDRKLIRNTIYIACAWVIWSSIYVMIVLSIGIEKGLILPMRFGHAPPTFAFECVMLSAFVLTWLLKGEVVLTDKVIQKR